MHHAITLRPKEDPQFDYLPLWLISEKELQVPGVKVDLLTRALVYIQHWTFLPLCVLVGRFNFYLISTGWAIKRLFTAPTRAGVLAAGMDILGMAIFWGWYCAVVGMLPEFYSRLLFVLVSHWTTGILHVQLLLSHLATSCFTPEEERAEQFFSFQLKTSRNVDSDWTDHWFHGGLEYQIEHHLFPQLPRHSLEAVKPFVVEICEKHGVPYRSVGFFHALWEIMSDLRRLSGALLELEMG